MHWLKGDELHWEVVMFANFGPGHWLVLGVVMVVMFAGSKLPDAARYAQVAAYLQVRVA